MHAIHHLRSDILVALLCLASHQATGADTQPVELLSNGDLSVMESGWPAGWPRDHDLSLHTESGRRFIRFTSPQPGKMVMAYRRVDLPKPMPAAMELSIKARCEVKVGDKPWFDVRVISHFKDAQNQIVDPDPPLIVLPASTKRWVDERVVFAVPARAAYLELMPCLFQVSSGTLDLAELHLRAAQSGQLAKPAAASAPAPIASAPIASTVRQHLQGVRLPPELHAAGNALQTSAGKAVWLQGLCLDSLEWSEKGEHLTESIPVAVNDWHANVIRLPISADAWWGAKGNDHDGGSAYRKVVDGCIDQANQHGAYLVLDLHRFGAMNAEDVRFWKDAATRYGNEPGVIFELFNEPHSISWKTWRSGATPQDTSHSDAKAEKSQPKDDAGATIGMQALLDAVRQAGAHNLVIAGGLDWGYDLSGVVNGFALSDKPGADGVMYSSHIYPWKKDWQHNTLDAAAKFPVFIGEVGCPRKWEDFSFIPAGARTEPLGPNCPWPADILGVIRAKKLNWTGFSFHPTCGPALITDWNYSPTSYWGVFVKDALAGKAFVTNHMR